MYGGGQFELGPAAARSSTWRRCSTRTRRTTWRPAATTSPSPADGLPDSPLPAAGQRDGLPLGLGRGSLRQRADLREQRSHIRELPLLHDAAVLAAADRQRRELDVPARRRHAHQLAVVPAADGRARRDAVAGAELLLDRCAEPGERFAIALHVRRETVGAAHLLRIQHVVRAEDVVQRVEVADRGVFEAGRTAASLSLPVPIGSSSCRFDRLAIARRGRSRSAHAASSVDLPIRVPVL